ncbi:glypican-6-like [Haemaphysalis longicornis]
MGKTCFGRFLLAVATSLVADSWLAAAQSSEPGCSGVKYAFQGKGFENDVPSRAISGEHLQICERSLTCCTQEMEHLLSAQSREEFERVLRDEIGKVRAKFAARMQRFDEFFRELLKTSKKDFHGMFLRTYGMQYDTNSYIFHDMFEQLEKYYRTGGVDLVDALDGFFLELYRKMFQVMNSQYALSERYLQCVSEYRDELRPFGDVPQKLTLEVKRSFVATRTFVQALGIGRDVIQSVMEVGPSANCSHALMKMSYCPHCHGLPNLKPCSSYCHSVMRGCLAHHMELDTEWGMFIDALMNLANRLESSFNIESVVNPIGVKISEAIMDFQENRATILDTLYDKCGKLRLARRGSGQELNFETLKFGGAGGGQQPAMRPTTAAGTSMDRLVQGIKKQIRATRSLWSQLPDRLCRQSSSEQPPPPTQEECWDGLNRAKSEGVNQTAGNAKVRGTHQQFQQQPPHSGHRGSSEHSSSSSNVVINQLILTLKIITNKLNLAYGGHDVQWQDSADLDDIGSGSGSGSGDDEYEPGRTSTVSDIFFSVSLPTSAPSPKHPVTPRTSSSTRAAGIEAPLWLLSVALLLKTCLSSRCV